MVLKLLNLKQKILKLFRNVSKDFAADNMKKTGLYGTLNDFSADYCAI